MLDKFLIRGEDGKHYNISDENWDEVIYLFEDDATHDFPTVKRIICKDKDILVLLKDLGIKQFDKLAFIKKYIFFTVLSYYFLRSVSNFRKPSYNFWIVKNNNNGYNL